MVFAYEWRACDNEIWVKPAFGNLIYDHVEMPLLQNMQ
jgi:hypothetical protein